jgi:hypothetical protein
MALDEREEFSVSNLGKGGRLTLRDTLEPVQIPP